eukprot:14234135-Alexandrium_andersonii.AAC.1
MPELRTTMLERSRRPAALVPARPRWRSAALLELVARVQDEEHLGLAAEARPEEVPGSRGR